MCFGKAARAPLLGKGVVPHSREMHGSQIAFLCREGKFRGGDEVTPYVSVARENFESVFSKPNCSNK